MLRRVNCISGRPRRGPQAPTVANQRHAPVESREIEHIAEYDKPDPVTRVAQLLAEVLDETHECERGVGLVR